MTKKEAIDYFGSAKKLADALVMSKQGVGQWPDVIPKGRQYQLQVLTKGKLKADG